MAVYHDLLVGAIKPASKTMIIQRHSNRDFMFTKNYFENLVRAGLLIKEGNHFKTTRKGFKYIKSQENLVKLINLPYFISDQ